ncbi:calcium-binding protein [Microvirga calopogonii]|uniref:calcium-binding protein n=1 Tax=Microvirga calopogonii TaxID=2078013 RepID=UPI000E0CE70E|nr:calcium-binding protein [Microvirga calopogonii]
MGSGAADSTVDVFDGAASEPEVTWLGGAQHLVSYRVGTTVGLKLVNGTNVSDAAVGITGAYAADVAALKNDAGNPNGSFVVVTDFGAAGIFARLYSGPNTTPTVIEISTAAKPSTGDFASVTALRGGGFAVTYIAQPSTPDADGRTDFGDVFVRVFNASGVAIGDPIRVNASAANDSIGAQNFPTISEMQDGRLAISWLDPTVGNGQVSSTIVDARQTGVTVEGTKTADIYVGSDFDDTLKGADGNDVLIGGLGSDSLDGGAEHDIASYQYAAGGISADLSTGKGTFGEAAGDTFTSIEHIIGSNFGDTLTGSDGASTLQGGTGDDVYFVKAGTTLVEGAGGGTDSVYSDATYSLANYAFIENLFATGSAAINLTGNESNNLIVGNEAANQIVGAGGDDTLRGAGGDDNLDGGDGNDVLDGGTGADVISGGAGSDNLDGGDGNDKLDGGAGDDVITGGFGADTIDGGDGNDNLVGGDGNDSIVGGNGDDVMNGGAGADVMKGGAGNDTYYIDDVNDQIEDTSGVDTVYLAVNYDIGRLDAIENITGVGAIDITLTGNDGNNTFTGNDGANILYGGNGNDNLNGGAGNDRIHGGDGSDILTGGSGRDIFVFDTKPNKSKNVDVITDFNVADDSIYLENKYFKVTPSGTLTKPKGMASKHFYKGAKAHDKDDRIIYDSKKGVLYYDADGTGGAAQIKIATLSKNLKMTHKDFFVI